MFPPNSKTTLAHIICLLRRPYSCEVKGKKSQFCLVVNVVTQYQVSHTNCPPQKIVIEKLESKCQLQISWSKYLIRDKRVFTRAHSFTIIVKKTKRQSLEKSTACFDSFCLTCLEEFYDFAVIKEKNKVGLTQLKGL